MKRLYLILAAGIVLSSCQKELSIDTTGSGGPNPNPPGGGGGNTTGELLIRVVTKTGSETSTTEYEYNANKQLMREKITGTQDGMDMGNDVRIIRNGAGIITGYVQKNALSAVQGVDSATTRVHYDVATQRYTSRVTEFTFMGMTSIDSAAYVYDNAGKIIKTEGYIGNSLMGNSTLMTVTEYTYGASGITEVEVNMADPADPAAPLELAIQMKYTFDSKVNPMNLPLGEAIVIQREDLFGTANPVTLDWADFATGTGQNMQFKLTYTYNSDNKPSTAVATETPANKTRNVSYFYK